MEQHSLMKQLQPYYVSGKTTSVETVETDKNSNVSIQGPLSLTF